MAQSDGWSRDGVEPHNHVMRRPAGLAPTLISPHTARMKYVLSVLCAVTASAALSADPMSAEEFEAYTTGKTLFFGQSGQAYGAEEYLPNRRVRWSFLDGQCQNGYWYEDDQEICFIYEGGDGPQCWTFQQSTGGLIAEFRGENPQPELYEAQDLGEEMVCLGPEVGV